MNNNGVRQVSDEEIRQTLTKEELQQTQVLNFQEVQKTIRFEKITSKRPAILIAVIGIISLVLGGSLQIATSLNSKPENIQKRDIKKDIKVEVKNLNGIKTTLNKEDYTDTVYNVTYKFENEKLVGFTKEYNVSAVTGKNEGKKSIEKYIEEYKKLNNNTEGYTIDISSTENTTITVKVVVDYKKLDLTKLNEIQSTEQFTKVDYNKNTSYSEIRSKLLDEGYTVE
jgi:hypothetical protein